MRRKIREWTNSGKKSLKNRTSPRPFFILKIVNHCSAPMVAKEFEAIQSVMGIKIFKM